MIYNNIPEEDLKKAKELLKNRYRLVILEKPGINDVSLMIHDGLSKDHAYELLAMYQDQGKTDLVVQQYYPEANRLGRDPQVH